MKKYDKKFNVYPDARALDVLGRSTGALNQALECWANIIARASADNSKDFAAAQWFWSNCDLGIDPRSDPWWTSAFRRTKAMEKTPRYRGRCPQCVRRR